MLHALRVCLSLVSIVIALGSPWAVSAASSCEVEAYKAPIPAGKPNGIVLLELKRQEFGSSSDALEGLGDYMDETYRGRFDRVGVDHSDDDKAVELDAYEIGALLPNVSVPTVGSASGYIDGNVMYAFYLENKSGEGLPSSTSDYVWEIIELVQDSPDHTLEDVLGETKVFDTTWKETTESVLSCR